MANEGGTQGIAVILVDHEGRLLLQLRDEKEGISLPGVWAILGGGLEAGESPDQAAKRELLEEIGQSVAALHLLGSVHWGHHTAHVFCGGAPFSEEAIIVGEGRGFRFFSREDIRRLEPVAPFVTPLLDAFIAGPLYERCRREAQGP